MNINLSSLLPEALSDEAAYQIVKLFAELALALEEYYKISTRAHPEFITPLDNSDDAWPSPDGEDPF